MIEARIKRALWAISIFVFLGFGAHGAYKFFDAYQIDSDAKQWRDTNENWFSETCSRPNFYLDLDTRRSCENASGMQYYYGYAPSRARGKGTTSIAIAVGVPVALWVLFFLLRWIWNGADRPQAGVR